MSGVFLDPISTDKLHKTLASSTDSRHNSMVWGGRANVEIHHVIPVSVAESYSSFFRAISKHGYGFDINAPSNLIVLPNSNDVLNSYTDKSGLFAAVHSGYDTQHRIYSDQISKKLASIHSAYNADVAAYGEKAAAQLAGARIDALKAETMNMLSGPSPSAVKLFLRNDDPTLIDQFKKANPSTGPPTKEQLAQFQAKNYDLIDFNKNARFEFDALTVKSVNGVLDGKHSGAVGTAALAITGASLVKLMKDRYGSLSDDQIIAIIKNSNLRVDPNKLVGIGKDIAFEAGLQILARVMGGPIALAYSAYDLYQSFEALRDALKLAGQAFPDNATLKKVNAAIDAAEAKLDAFTGGNRKSAQQIPADQKALIRDVFEKKSGFPGIDQCFPAGTPILMGDGSTKPIEAVRAGDLVMAFNGLEALEPRPVVQLLRATTREWIVLHFPENPGRPAVVMTPDHPVLLPDGSFRGIQSLLADSDLGMACLVDEDGSTVRVSGRRVAFSAETADLFEQACGETASRGSLALAPRAAWATYNFEVEGLHTYVAGGLRVHNACEVVLLDTDFTNSALVETLEALGLMEERQASVQRVIMPDGQEFLFIREAARMKHADGSVSSVADFVGMLQEQTRTFVDIVGQRIEALPSYLAGVAPAVISDLVMGRDVEKVAEQYAIQVATTMGVDALAQLFGLEGRKIGFEINSGRKVPVIDGVKFLDTAEGQAVKGAIVHFAVVAALRGSEMSGGDWAKLAANASIRSAVTYVVQEYGGAWAAQEVVKAYTSTGAKVVGKQLTPAGAGAVAAAITFFSNLTAKGFKDFDQTLLQTAIAGGTAYAGAKIGAILGNFIPVPGLGAIIGATIGSVLGNLLGGLFGGRKLPPPPPLVVIETNADGTQTIQVTPHSTGYTIAAREGFDDALVGGARFDVLVGSSGNNRLFGQAGDDLLFGQGGHDVMDGGSGRDELHGGAGMDTLIGGAGHDILYGDDHSDSVELSGSTAGGNDVILGEDGDDQAHGGGGDDHLDGGTGADSLQGGHGADTLIGGTGTDVLYGAAGDDILYGDTIATDGTTTTIAGAENDRILGGDGSDTVYGGGGDDTLEGGTGHDVIYGDGVSFTRVGTAVQATPRDTGADLIDAGEGNDTVVAGAGHDTVQGQAGNDDLDAGDGNDLVEADAGNDAVRAGSGRDTVVGGDGDDRLAGGDDDDVLSGDAGRDDLDGGLGADRLSGGADDDVLRGDLGDDLLLGEGGNDLALGGLGNDVLDGGDGADTLLGDIGQDTIDGGAGHDSLSGGADADLLRAGDGADSVAAGAGHDAVTGGAGDDLIAGDAGADTLAGEDGADTLQGGDDDDRLDGGTGQDLLQGGSGNDTLVATADRDRLEGGSGNDSYEIAAGASAVISDLSGTDMLVIGGISGARDLAVMKEGQDLVLSSRTNPAASVRIEGHFGGGGTVEAIRLADGFTLNISKMIVGSNGADSLIGTDDADGILGLGGNDAILGEGGDDFLDGGDGEDVVFAGAGNDVVHGSGEDDLLVGDAGADTIVGGAGDDMLVGAEGSDHFVADRTEGTRDVVSDFDLAADRIDLSRFGDRFVSLKQMQMFGTRVSQSGQNTAIALGGGAQLVLESINAAALAERHFLFDLRAVAGVTGTDGNDIIAGTSGDDTIADGRGFDVMSGGAGRDVFRLSQAAGTIDTITDFSLLDRLDLSSVAEVVSVDQLDMDQVGADTVINLSGGQKVVLENVNRASLTDASLVFDVFRDLTGQERSPWQVQHDFAPDAAAEDNRDILPGGLAQLPGLAAARSNVEQLTFNPGAQYSGTDYYAVNLWTTGNFSTTGIDQTLYNNEYWVRVGGKRKSWELRRNTDFHGSGWDDQMFGSWWSERIFAGGGNDLVYGGAGHDQIYGGDGNDYLIGNEDNDFIAGENGHDALFGSSGFDALYGSWGNDALFGEGENDVLVGEHGDDYLDGGWGNDHLVGQWGRDVLLGGEGQDALAGEDHDDHVNGQGGHDTLWGGAGNDLLLGGWGFDILFGEDGNDRLFGEGDADQLHGHNGNDELGGGLGNDLLWGNAGNDRLNGDDGDDVANGGDGSDIVHGDLGNDTLHGDERADVGDRDALYGGAGQDLVFGLAGNDLAWGGAGHDTVWGGRGHDSLFGEDGDDVLRGEDGHDLIRGGAGRDWLHGGAGVDVLYGDEDNDILYGGSGSDLLSGGDGSDLLAGGGNGDLILAGNDHDIVLGQDGDDQLHGEAGDDVLDGGAGHDQVLGGSGRDSVSGGTGDDSLLGGAGNDILDGGEGQDDLRGEDGSDVLRGGAGADTIVGGSGGDVIHGGADADLIRYESWTDTTRSGADILADFDTARDRIDVSALRTEFGKLRFAVDGQFTEVTIEGSEFYLKVGRTDAALQQSHFVF